MSAEHRTQTRHQVRFRLVYDDGSSFNSGVVHDVSEGGLYLETAMPLPVGAFVRLTPLETTSKEFFEVQARVVRTAFDAISGEPAGMGLQFLHLGEAERRDLVRLIRELQDKAALEHTVLDPYLGVRVPESVVLSGTGG
jgi:uncharacterized protein (TIGR02266 family)